MEKNKVVDQSGQRRDWYIRYPKHWFTNADPGAIESMKEMWQSATHFETEVLVTEEDVIFIPQTDKPQ